MIKAHIKNYIKMYVDKFGVKPKSWFSFLSWLSSFTMAGSFNESDIELAKQLLAEEQ
jgi:hypothetical protein